VRDHDHITGKYRGAAHNSCNLQLRIIPYKVKIPVVFHNLRGFDGHLIMAGIKNAAKDKKITCIPNNMEKYMTFSISQLQFIDSLQFMNASLDSLVKNLQKDDFKIFNDLIHKDNQDILRRKGVFPYEYISNLKKLSAKQLPPKEAFYSRITKTDISDEDYDHAQNVWKQLDMKTMWDYHNAYLYTDVILLADVFENFRNTSMTHYGLDPAHYFSSPGMSWDALLKLTKVKIELLTDIDMHLFIEKGLRGGVSMVSKRFAKANNPMVENYDKSKSNTWIMYYDANNLYGWAMSQPLPISNFKWIKPEDLPDINTISDDSKYGCILEVDLEYPAQLHKLHTDYPLAPEVLHVQENWMSAYQQHLHKKLGTTFNDCDKLVPNLYHKTKYILHYRNLKLYTQQGMKVTKIHRVLKFKQDPWMKPYIELNTNLRKAATSDFEKDFFKLMNNSVFGKTMENLRKRINVDLVRGSETNRLRKLVANPGFISRRIFNEHLAAIHRTKAKLTLNRPIYVGMTVLDLSKLLMYDFYYNDIKKQYGNNVQLLYTDTDSLLLEINTDNIYEDMYSQHNLYDTSDYPKDHKLYCTDNKKVLGKFKDECNGIVINEFVGLRPKMYSILIGNNQINKAKGISKPIVVKELSHDLYKKSLFGEVEMRHEMYCIKSENHNMGVYKINKTSLSPLDTKKYINKDGITTLAYGYGLKIN
jgi:hypothetical protein